MSSSTELIDGLNISLIDAIRKYGCKCEENGECCIESNGKKFVITNLQGVLKEIPAGQTETENQDINNLEKGIEKDKVREADGTGPNNDLETPNTKLTKQELKEKKEEEKNDVNKREQNLSQTEALEQVGFHVVKDESSNNGKNNNVNKDVTIDEEGNKKLNKKRFNL